MVFGGGAFWRHLGHKGVALINGINVLIKENPPSSLAYVRVQEVCDRKDGPHLTTLMLVLDFHPPEP